MPGKFWSGSHASFRSVYRDAGFTISATITVAVAIAAGTAMFDVLYAVLLKQLPYSRPEGIVKVFSSDTKDPGEGAVSTADFRSIQQQGIFEKAALARYWLANLTGMGQPKAVKVYAVTSEFFRLFGVPAYRGRTFGSGSRQGAGEVVLSFRFWQEQLHLDRGCIGQSFLLDRTPFVAVGIMPKDFDLLDGSDMWVPSAMSPYPPGPRGQRDGDMYARVAPARSLAQISSALSVVAENLSRTYSATNATTIFTVHPLEQVILGKYRPILYLLSGAVALVVLIAWLNLAQLALTRGTKKRQDMAIRLAMGAGYRTVFYGTALESAILCVPATLAGLAFADWAMHAFQRLAPIETPRLAEAGIGVPAVLFAAGICAVSIAICAFFPMLAAPRSDPGHFLKGAADERFAKSLLTQSGRRGLLIGQLALGMMLVLGSLLILRSLGNLLQVNPGFSSHHAVTMNLCLRTSRYGTDARQREFFARLYQSLSSLRGLEGSALSTDLPLSESESTATVSTEGAALSQEWLVRMESVSPGYFRAWSIPVLEGRDFNETDLAGRPAAVIVNRAFARRSWPNGAALGKLLHGAWAPPGQWTQVVGVVGDVRSERIGSEPPPTVYLPFQQVTASCMYVIARAAPGAGDVAPAIFQQVARLDPDQAITKIRNSDEMLENALRQPRFLSLLLSAFAGFAVLLAAVGVYGVISYWVMLSTKSIAVRTSIGATHWDILRLTMGQTMDLVLPGLILGLAMSAIASQFLSKFLYQVRPNDPLVFMLSSIFILVICVVATLVPIHRAMSVDPVRALRYE